MEHADRVAGEDMRPITTLIDHRLPDHETVYGAAGSAHSLCALPSSQPVDLTHAEYTDAAE